MAMDPITLTREELYDRVWTEAMALLGPKLGLSDVGLKKTCARMRIPTPPRGYWARVAAGKKVRRTPLPKLPESASASMRSASFFRRTEPQVPQPPRTGPVADQEDFEGRPENRLVVPEILEHPCPLVAKTIVALRKAKPDESGRLATRGAQTLDVSVTLGTADRAMRILDTLIKGLNSRSYGVSLSKPAPASSQYGPPSTPSPKTVVRIGQDDIAFRVTEQVTRSQRPPTRRDGGWEPKEYDYTPTGNLSLEIIDVSARARAKWSDGKRQRLEEMLGDIIVGFVETAEALREQRDRWAEAAGQRELEEAQRKEKERQAHFESERVRALDGFMRRLRKARAVRDYVETMRAAALKYGHSEHPELNAWLSWAEKYAERLDPAGGGRIQYHTDANAADYYPWNKPAEDTRPIW